MAHHGANDDPEIRRVFEALNDQHAKLGIGPTDEYPEGKLSESDEGEIRIAVGVERGKIVLHFGEPTLWVGMTPQQAADLAASLIQKARGISRSPFSISL